MENCQVKISVIVPCYKVEQYLEKCVNSILASSFKDFEVILVDDGSPDHSGEIADALAEKDPRIQVIHKENGGVVKARETGVDAAVGEWITLVDSDDSITPNALEDLYNAAIGKDADIIIGFPVGNPFPEVPIGYDMDQYRSDIISGIRIQAAPWGRLIRRSIITPFLFDIPRKVRLGDDMIFNIRCSFATDKDPVVVKTYVYDYFTNEASITRTNKRDPEYEQFFHEIRMKSIPEREQTKYISSIIYDRLHPVKWWSFHNPFDTTWMNSPFVEQIRKDIKDNNYPITFRQDIMLNQRYKLIRGILIPIFRMVDLIKKH